MNKSFWIVIITLEKPTNLATSNANEGSIVTQIGKYELSFVCWEKGAKILRMDKKGRMCLKMQAFSNSF